MADLPRRKFWMVYGIGQGAPTRQHDTDRSAAQEARRLARGHPGITFVVLEAVAAVAKREFDTVLLRSPSAAGDPFDDEEIPF